VLYDMLLQFDCLFVVWLNWVVVIVRVVGFGLVFVEVDVVVG